MKKIIISGGALLLTPSIVLAADATSILDTVGNILGMLVPLFITLAVVYFLYGLAKYILSQDKEEGRNMMVWGIIALFVMVSIWGLVNIISETFLGGDSGNAPDPTNLIPNN